MDNYFYNVGQPDPASTIPARAEALDEGAAELAAGLRGMARECMETMDEAQADVLIRSAVALEARAHPSLTPAADDNRVRIACEKEAIAGALGNVLPLDINWQHIRVASQAFVEALAALKSEGK